MNLFLHGKPNFIARLSILIFYLLFTGQNHDTKSSVNPSLHGAAESEGLVNLGLFADRRSAYRMFAAEGT